MSKDLKKEANKILSHLSKQCFDLRVSAIMQREPEKIEKLRNEEGFIFDTYKECINLAKSMFPKVARNTFFEEKVSLKLIDKDFILKELITFHKEMDFMKESQK